MNRILYSAIAIAMMILPVACSDEPEPDSPCPVFAPQYYAGRLVINTGGDALRILTT